MMLSAMFMFTTMGICIRLSSAYVPVLEIVFFRNFLALLIMAPVLIRSGSASIRMNRSRLFFGRAAVNFIGMLSGFTAVTLIPLADMTSLTFTGPIFVTIGAALFLAAVVAEADSVLVIGGKAPSFSDDTCILLRVCLCLQ